MRLHIPLADLDGKRLTIAEKGKELTGGTVYRARLSINGAVMVLTDNRGAAEWSTPAGVAGERESIHHRDRGADR